jgi:enolase-phosphatase E1
VTLRAILTDIEGTTSSISFVKDVLFPYARSRMGDFVRAHGAEPEVAALLADARAEAGDPGLDLDGVIAVLEGWIDADRKVTPLKALQGLIWEAGYAGGDFRGHVYPDTAPGLRRLAARGLGLHVYSSGSVKAQKLIFGHSEAGDLTGLFSGWFDTRMGAKVAANSYDRICGEIGRAPGEVLFLSDLTAELDAARDAGLLTLQFVREGDLDPRAAHPQVRDFEGVDAFLDSAA